VVSYSRGECDKTYMEMTKLKMLGDASSRHLAWSSCHMLAVMFARSWCSCSEARRLCLGAHSKRVTCDATQRKGKCNRPRRCLGFSNRASEPNAVAIPTHPSRHPRVRRSSISTPPTSTWSSCPRSKTA
jgi:hypothetical protein